MVCFKPNLRVCIYSVQPPGTINDSVLLVVSFLFTSLVISASNESQTRRRFWNINCPRTLSNHLSVNFPLIYAFEELVTEHCCLYSSRDEFDSLFAALNTINGFSLVPSNLAAKKTETRGFPCPVSCIATIL